MKKHTMKLGLVAALMMGSVSAAYAGTDATVKITGSVVTHSCDLSSSRSSVSAGNLAVADFKAAKTPVFKGNNAFTVTANCQGAEAVSPGTDLAMQVQGQQSDTTDIALWGLNNGTGVGFDLQGNGPTAGAVFTSVTPATSTIILKAGAAGATAAGVYPVNFTVGMSAPSITGGAIKTGTLSTDLTFTMAP